MQGSLSSEGGTTADLTIGGGDASVAGSSATPQTGGAAGQGGGTASGQAGAGGDPTQMTGGGQSNSGQAGRGTTAQAGNSSGAGADSSQGGQAGETPAAMEGGDGGTGDMPPDQAGTGLVGDDFEVPDPVEQIPAPKVVAPCNTDSSSVGVWENITPSGVHTPGVFVADPSNTATLYLATNGQGIQKTTDCGANWFRVDDGKSKVDGPEQSGPWAMQIDPVDPRVLYVNMGYGEHGVFKSEDAGVTWRQILKEDVFSVFIFGGFIGDIQLDRTDHLHIGLTPHFTCDPPYDENCMLESFDGGDSWRVLEGTPGGTEGDTLQILSRTEFYWARVFDGMFRSTDGGSTWTLVSPADGAMGREIVVSDDGSWLAPSVRGVLRTLDEGASWQKVENGPVCQALVGGNGKLFSSMPNAGYATARMDSPTVWQPLDFPIPGSAGWLLYYDPDHDILYSSNGGDGLWRLVMSTPPIQ